MKHLLKLQDLDKNEILDILNLADQLKYENQQNRAPHSQGQDSRYDFSKKFYKNKSKF